MVVLVLVVYITWRNRKCEVCCCLLAVSHLPPSAPTPGIVVLMASQQAAQQPPPAPPAHPMGLVLAIREDFFRNISAMKPADVQMVILFALEVVRKRTTGDEELGTIHVYEDGGNAWSIAFFVEPPTAQHPGIWVLNANEGIVGC